MNRADVLIVGAGPAGGAAALALARSGLKVAVLEQSRFPRLKPCGGLMPATVMASLGWDFSHLVRHAASRLDFSHNARHPHQKRLKDGALLLVDRAEFDQALIDEAIRRSLGKITLHQECKVVTVTQNDAEVIVTCRDGETFHGQALIGADGARGVVATSCGLNDEAQTAVAVDADLQVPESVQERWNGRVEFNFFCIPDGYGWVFPKGPGRLSAGLLSWTGQRGIKTALEGFIKQTFSASEINSQSIHGFPVPEFNGGTRLSKGRVCLAGDAASLVDPVSGEGIRFALASGRLAAQKIVELLQGDRQATFAASYLSALQSPGGIFQGLQHSQRFVRLAFRGSPRFFFDHHIVQSDLPFYW